jgi:hypothetical protein
MLDFHINNSKIAPQELVPNEHYIFDQLFHINLYSVSVAYLYFVFIILLLLIISNIPTNF